MEGGIYCPPDDFGGRPKIDVIVGRFISDQGTAVASHLAGAVDGSQYLNVSSALTVKREWERAGQKPGFIVQSTHWRLMEVQLRPELARPAAIVDPRIRRGLLHAMDRRGLVDALPEGLGPVLDTFMPQDDVKWDWVKDVAVRYDYDPRRAHDVLATGGWVRGGDGGLIDATGNRVDVQLMTRPSQKSEQEVAIIADYWKAIGLGVEQVVLSAGQARDNKVVATFPAFTITSNPTRFKNILDVVHGPQCPVEEANWARRNHGCYRNPAWDRTVDALMVAIDPADQRRLWRDLVKTHTEELPVMPLYFDVRITLFRDGGDRGQRERHTISLGYLEHGGVGTVVA